MRLQVELLDGEAGAAPRPLGRHSAGNAMSPMLPLFDALASGEREATLKAGPGRILRAAITYPERTHG